MKKKEKERETIQSESIKKQQQKIATIKRDSET